MTPTPVARPLGRRRFATLCLPLAAAACGSSPDPRLYSIGVKQGAALPGGPKTVLLRDIGLAGYLDRKQIVRSQDDNLLALHGNDWWGEPLGPMIGRTLVIELSQRLPSSNVYAEGGAISVDPNAIVAVNIQRMEVDKGSSLVLLAQAAVEFNRPKRSAARTFNLARALPATDTAGQVVAISDALGELADGLAQMLQG